jgi:hypothetical protein
MNHDRIEELEARISACPGWRLGRELSGLARSYKVFLGNDAELRDYLRRHSELPTVLELWSVQNREGFERFLDEVDRLLHNYVAGAGTLRDHTRRVWQKHAPVIEATREEYERRIALTFADSSAAQLVKGLRNYTFHRRLPVARGRLSWVKDESFDSIVFLERKELLAWDGWSPPARQTLETAPEDVNLAEVVDQYSDAVVEFNTWFGEAFVGGHLEAFDELRDLKQQLAVLYWEGGAVE